MQIEMFFTLNEWIVLNGIFYERSPICVPVKCVRIANDNEQTFWSGQNYIDTLT